MKDGLENVSYEYQWLADDTDIAGATGASHTLTASGAGQDNKGACHLHRRCRIRRVSDQRGDGDAVAARPNRDATGLPTISGIPEVEQTLTVDTSAINDEDGLTSVT